MNESDLSVLEDIRKQVKAGVDQQKDFRRSPYEPPYPADAPCYYCQFNTGQEYEEGESPCRFCIHNPDAVIYSEIIERIPFLEKQYLRFLEFEKDLDAGLRQNQRQGERIRELIEERDALRRVAKAKKPGLDTG